MKGIVDKINEGFFDNIGGKEYIFLKELKDTLDNWKTSSNKEFLITQLDRICYKAQKENLDFDICIESNLKSSHKIQYAIIAKFWNKYYEVSDKPDGIPIDNICWTVRYCNVNTNDIDTFNPSARTVDGDIYKIDKNIARYVKYFANGSKKDITFKVRISLDNPKHTKWV